MSCVAPLRTLALAYHSIQVIEDSRPPHSAWSDKGQEGENGELRREQTWRHLRGSGTQPDVSRGRHPRTLGCLERLGRMSPRAHTGNAHATREFAIGKSHPGAAEAAVISL